MGQVVRMMTGGTVRHDLIASNIVGALRTARPGGPCFAHASHPKIVTPFGVAVYPEAWVRCAPSDDDMATHVTDPVLVVEVDSPSIKP